MSDRVKSGLRGPVWSCLTEHTMYARQCGAEACLTEESVYDELGLPVELAFSDSQGRVLRRVSFRYDEAGRLMEEADENRGLEALLEEAQIFRAVFAGDQGCRRFHRYDERGRRVETWSTWGLLGGDRKTVVYNEQGDPAAEHYEHVSREFAIDDQGHLAGDGPNKENAYRTEARFTYTYDEQGNWVEQVVAGRNRPDEANQITLAKSIQ